jgi:PAS domain S-box-containing protein
VDAPVEVRHDATVLVLRDGTIASWDVGARELFGRSPEEVLGLPFCSLFAADCHDAVDGLARATPSEPLRIVATGLDKDDVRFDAEITSTRTLAVRNGATGVVHVVRDVTEERAVNAALLACAGPVDCAGATAQVAEVMRRWVSFEQLRLAVRVNGRYRTVGTDSPEGRAMVRGASLRRMSGALCELPTAGSAVIVQDTRARLLRVDATLAALGIGSYAVLPVVSDGRMFALLNVAFAQPHMATPRIVRLLGAVAEAIGPPLLRTLELEEKSRAVGRLERLTQREKELLAFVTHDMRTPLTVIAGFAGNLRNKWHELSEGERLDELDAILRNGENLTRLVEQDLQLALVETGKFPCLLTTVDLVAHVTRVVGDFTRTSDTPIALRVDDPVPPVRADPSRAAQVLTNLLSNAVKFSPAGAPIDVAVFRRDQMVHVAVSDQGDGISPRDARELFRKFACLDRANGGEVRGIGLGLYLSKCMIEAQHGRIWVDSRLGEGATFTFSLPVASGSPAGP